MLRPNKDNYMSHRNAPVANIRDIDSTRFSNGSQITGTVMKPVFTILPNIDCTNELHDDVLAIWLDNTIGSSMENSWYNTVGRIRQIIPHVKVFNNVHECTDYVCSSGIEQIFLIVSGTYGDDFDARLFEKIIDSVFIYVLISDKLEHNGNYSSICGYFDNTITLINQIHDDYKIYTAEKLTTMDSIRINTYENTTRCTDPQMIQWKCFHLMMDIFRKMPCPREQSMDRLIQLCKSYCRKNRRQLKILTEFQDTYQPHHALRWYTRDCFLYRLLNESIRKNDIDAMMNFSHILTDIYEQLHELQRQQRVYTESSAVVYRGTRIGITELQQLKFNIGRFISNYAIFSTSADLMVARIFMGDTDTDQKGRSRVLFEISFDRTSSDLKPFADVSNISAFSGEREVLFTNGHIFRIDSCELTADNSWLVQLTVCDNSNPIAQNSFDYFDIAVLQLLEILPGISPNTNKANDRLLQWWRLYCADDPIEQAKVDQFEESYRSDSAIRWYTKDSLLYRLLNTALRKGNVDMIIDFRYFIIDLYDQLTKSHLDYIRTAPERNLTAYRGQKINPMELRRLKHSIGNYISINSFFSASLSSEVAVCFAELDESDRKQHLQSVLFQIDIDMEKLARSSKNHIFAKILNMSCFVDEEEVLFMANTQFRIHSVADWDGRFWLIRLTLITQDDENSNEMRLMNQYLDRLTDVIAQRYSDGDGIRSFFENIILKKK